MLLSLSLLISSTNNFRELSSTSASVCVSHSCCCLYTFSLRHYLSDMLPEKLPQVAEDGFGLVPSWNILKVLKSTLTICRKECYWYWIVAIIYITCRNLTCGYCHVEQVNLPMFHLANLFLVFSFLNVLLAASASQTLSWLWSICSSVWSSLCLVGNLRRPEKPF